MGEITRSSTNASSDGARFSNNWGISDETAKVAAKGRPVVGVDADDAIFHTFMILEDYHRRLAHLMMRWAQRHGFTHQRQFEEPLETFDVSEEADGMELVE